MTTTAPGPFSTPSPTSASVNNPGKAPFTFLSKASFLGIEFRCEDIAIKGGIRKHVHEYPHSPGGQSEKLGRKLYQVTMNATFMVNDKFFPTAWPGDIGMLRAQFENQVTGDLVIPTVGTIQAYAVDWDIANTAKIMNGEKMRILFEEDSQKDQLVDAPLVLQYTSLSPKMDALILEATKLSMKTSIFDSIAQLASDIESYKDRVDLYGTLITNKTQQLADECRQMDALVTDLNKAAFWRVVDALHDLAVAADNLHKDSLLKLSPIGIYTTPFEMTISELSSAIYGDTTHGFDILKLNTIADAFAIPPLSSVRYYQTPGALLT